MAKQLPGDSSKSLQAQTKDLTIPGISVGLPPADNTKTDQRPNTSPKVPLDADGAPSSGVDRDPLVPAVQGAATEEAGSSGAKKNQPWLSTMLNFQGLPDFSSSTASFITGTSRKQVEYIRPQCLCHEEDGQMSAYLMLYHKCRLSYVFLSNNYLYKKLGLLTSLELPRDKAELKSIEVDTAPMFTTSRQLQKTGLLNSLSIVIEPLNSAVLPPFYDAYKTILPYNSDLAAAFVARLLYEHRFTFTGSDGVPIVYKVKESSIKSANQRSTSATFF